MKFKAVIFDFDGVLIDSEIVNIEAGVRGFAEFGYELTQEDRATIVGRHSEDYIQTFQKKYGFDEEMRRTMLKKIEEEFRVRFGGLIKLQSGVKEILNYLEDKKVVMGIATTNRKVSVETFFQKFGLEKYFNFVITWEDVVRGKPDPEIYLLAKSRVNAKDEEILAIEDTGIGVESAKAAGLVCAAIPTAYTKDNDFSKADYVFSSMKDLVKLFNEKTNFRH